MFGSKGWIQERVETRVKFFGDQNSKNSFLFYLLWNWFSFVCRNKKKLGSLDKRECN